MTSKEIEAQQLAIQSWATQERKARQEANKLIKWANTLRAGRVKAELQLWIVEATLALDGIYRREIDGCVHLRFGERECRIPAGGYVLHGRILKHGKFRTVLTWQAPGGMNAEQAARYWLLGLSVVPWVEVGTRKFLVTGHDGTKEWTAEKTENEVAQAWGNSLDELHHLQVGQELGLGSGTLLKMWAVIIKRIA